MSGRVFLAAIPDPILASAMAILLSAVACATEPNVPPRPPIPAQEEPAAVSTLAQVARAPLRPAPRTPASFTPEMPLHEAIDILRNCTRPPLGIIVLWRDLDAAGIYRDTPIGIDGLPGLRVGQYLDLLVLSLSAGASDEIGYTVHHGVVTIATTAALPAPKSITRVYDISDLTAPPSNASMPRMGYGGMYGGQMMGLNGGYGGGLGTGYGMGPSSMPGGAYGSAGFPGAIGNSYGRTRVRSSGPRGR